MATTPTPPSGPITITITLQAGANGLTDNVSYSNGSGTARERKQNLLQTVQAKKQSRGRTFVVPHADHSEDLDHDSWITNPGDTVVWKCNRAFALFIDHDLAPCDDLRGAPRNPFGWTGVQMSSTTAPFEISGEVLDNRAVRDQMFYKFTALVQGLDPLDPDGLCGSGVGP